MHIASMYSGIEQPSLKKGGKIDQIKEGIYPKRVKKMEKIYQMEGVFYSWYFYEWSNGWVQGIFRKSERKMILYIIQEFNLSHQHQVYTTTITFTSTSI